MIRQHEFILVASGALLATAALIAYRALKRLLARNATVPRTMRVPAENLREFTLRVLQTFGAPAEMQTRSRGADLGGLARN